MIFTFARSLLLLMLGLLSCPLLGETPPEQLAASESAGTHGGMNVLILGDSLALCGFGKRLDERFRKNSNVKSAYTYIACGTNPLSWLKEKPYADIKARCGFWSIESVVGSAQPKQMEDVYGMRRGSSPKGHPVPKIEDLLPATQPDIVVMQTGTNLFGLFPDHKSISPRHDGPALRKYITGFISKAARIPSPLRKLYWVAPPTSGRVSKEIQDFVFEQTRAAVGGAGVVIDSRALVSYPYQHMEPDKEHFIGAQMDEWADKVYGIIERDLSAQPLASAKPLHQSVGTPAGEDSKSSTEKTKTEPLYVSARLLFKTEPIAIKELLPYQEFLVGYLYEVRRVIAGAYSEKQILVMHPAYIGLKKQRLDQYRVGRVYSMRLRELDDTVWTTAKSKDASGSAHLQPYITIEDEVKYPGNAR